VAVREFPLLTLLVVRSCRLDPLDNLLRQRDNHDIGLWCSASTESSLIRRFADVPAGRIGRAANAAAKITDADRPIQPLVEDELSLEHRVAGEPGESGKRLRRGVSLPGIGLRQRSSFAARSRPKNENSRSFQAPRIGIPKRRPARSYFCARPRRVRKFRRPRIRG
jgi:hypothetical protein